VPARPTLATGGPRCCSGGGRPEQPVWYRMPQRSCTSTHLYRARRRPSPSTRDTAQDTSATTARTTAARQEQAPLPLRQDRSISKLHACAEDLQPPRHILLGVQAAQGCTASRQTPDEVDRLRPTAAVVLVDDRRELADRALAPIAPGLVGAALPALDTLGRPRRACGEVYVSYRPSRDPDGQVWL